MAILSVTFSYCKCYCGEVLVGGLLYRVEYVWKRLTVRIMFVCAYVCEVQLCELICKTN